MIVVRNTFQVKFGRMREAVALMKENIERTRSMSGSKPPRLLTDLTGTFYTLVLEFEFENLADSQRGAAEAMNAPGFRETYQKFAAVVDSGRREIFSVVE